MHLDLVGQLAWHGEVGPKCHHKEVEPNVFRIVGSNVSCLEVPAIVRVAEKPGTCEQTEDTCCTQDCRIKTLLIKYFNIKI